MNSHAYQTSPAVVVRMLASTGLPLVILVIVIQAGLMLDLLPARKPPMNSDQFMMHQRHDFTLGDDHAEILVIGDSTSLMGVDALRLNEQLPGHPRVYNLGLFLGLPLTAYGEVAGDFIRRHPGQVKTVLLLTTAWRLIDARAMDVNIEFWRRLRAGEDQGVSQNASLLDRLPTLTDSKARLISRLLPFLAHEKIGVYYGRILSAEKHLNEFNGSLVSQGSYNRSDQETITWDMDAAARDEGAAIRELIPRDVELLFGIMPMPETSVSTSPSAGRENLIQAFNETLQADGVLNRIPATLPDGFFADHVHLNEQGQKWFTDSLAQSLTARRGIKKLE